MRVLICPDKFAGSLSAVEAADAIAHGWVEAAPDDPLVRRPLADGGPGFLDVIAAAVGGRRITVPTVDPLGRPVWAQVLVVGETAYVESAQACGLHLLDAAERDPTVTTSFGLGELIAAAAATGVREIVVGLGGSATNDCGAGMLAALGTAPLDADGNALPPGGAVLVDCVGLSGAPEPGAPEPGGVGGRRGGRLIAATDVSNPLVGPDGASSVFGPQKGASPESVVLLDHALTVYSGVLERTLPTCPPGLAHHPGAGAAGGLGAALVALGGRVVSGTQLVRDLTGLDDAMASVDLVVTGEGSFDSQSLRGKLISGVAAAARDRGLRCVVLAGRASVGHREAAALGVTETHTLVEHFGNAEEAMARAAEGLAAVAGQVARAQRGA